MKMAHVPSELLTPPLGRTAINDDPTHPTFTTDFYRCGKCASEFDQLEDFIFHKIIVEKNNLVLWDSEKISGIQIPRFLESGVNIFVSQEDVSSEIQQVEEQLPTLLYCSVDTHKQSQESSIKSHNKLDTFKTKPDAKIQESIRRVHEQSVQRIESSNKAQTFSPQKQIQQSSAHSKNQQLSKLTPTSRHHPQPELHSSTSQLIKPECKTCGNTYRDHTTLRTHISTVHSNNRPFRCKFKDCPSAFKTKASMQRHVRRHTGERPFNCDDCGRSFRESGTLSRHMKARVPCIKKGDSDLPRYGKCNSLPLKCSQDNSETSVDEDCSEQQYENTSQPETLQIVITKMSDTVHVETTEEQVESVAENSAQVEDKSIPEVSRDVIAHPDFAQLLEAVTRLRPEPVPPLSVDAAPEPPPVPEVPPLPETLDPQQVRSTICEQLQEQNLQCMACEEHLQTPQNLSQHLQIHLEDFRFRCAKCYYVCRDKNSLTNHSRNMHGRTIATPLNGTDDEESRWTQVAVMQLLILNDILDEQEATETESTSTRNCGSNRCHVCLKKFQGRGYFSLHMGTHTGEQPHICQYCQRTFICKDSLKKHLISHSADRRFQCGICSKLFKRASHIREHLRTHSENKHFFCKICGRGFKWQGALKAHELTHSHDVPFICDACGRRFRARSSLIRHARRHLPTNRLIAPRSIVSAIAYPAASCEEDTLHLQPEGTEMTHNIQDEEPAYLLILEDGSTCLVPKGVVIQAGLLDPASMWRQSQPSNSEEPLDEA